MREFEISLFPYMATRAGWPGLPCPALGRPIAKLTSRRFRYFSRWPPYNEIPKFATHIFRYMDGAPPEVWPSPARPACRACLSLLGSLSGSPWHPLPGCMALPMLLAAAGPAVGFLSLVYVPTPSVGVRFYSSAKFSLFFLGV